MPGIQKMFDSGQVRFSSLHNFCPLPVEVMVASPDCYQLSAVSSEERERAVKQTFKQLILPNDWAHRLCASFGPGENAANYRSIDQDDESGQAPLSRIRTSETESVETRERRAPAHLQRVKDCLRRIVEHAASKNCPDRFRKPARLRRNSKRTRVAEPCWTN
jgi:hypothetical protein